MVFFPLGLAILQSTNQTLKELAWLLLGATKCKHRWWHPKGRESLEDPDHWSREKGNAQESTNTPQKGTGTRKLLDFSWKIPQASPAASASELKWLRKKKKSGKRASQRDLLEKKEGKEKWLNSILLILKANSSCLS